MRKFKILKPIGFLAIIAGFSAIVMLLWNWLMPSIFALGAINFWQALGLLALARILFGHFGFGRKGMMHHHGMRENLMHKKWMKMTPEQREEFINKRRKFGFGGHFGHDCFDFDTKKQEEQ